MRKLYSVLIVTGIAIVIICAGAYALMRPGAGVELASSSYTAEYGWELVSYDDGQVDEGMGVGIVGYKANTYVNVTVTVHNAGQDSKECVLSAVLTDERGVIYYNTGGVVTLSIEGGAVKECVLKIVVTRDIVVTDDMLKVYLDGVAVQIDGVDAA